MAALSFRVHSATTLALISFIYNMKAFRGFFTWGFFSSSFFTVTGDFLGGRRVGVSMVQLSLGSCRLWGELQSSSGAELSRFSTRNVQPLNHL